MIISENNLYFSNETNNYGIVWKKKKNSSAKLIITKAQIYLNHNITYK